MAYFKAKLQRTDVSGKVKGHFKSHMEFMCLLGEKVVIEILNEILDLFLTEYHYIPPVSSETSHPVHKDEMFNYFNNFSHWFIHITALNRVAKDGDITRIISCKYWESERGGHTCTTRVTGGGSKPIPDTEVDKTSLIFGESLFKSANVAFITSSS
jgi:hypothetical protein